MLMKISVCQNTVCQNKGSKAVLHRLQNLYNENPEYRKRYPELIIESGDCNGDCELGPIVRINDSILMREVDNQQAQRILDNPEDVIGQVMHVLEKDRETFDRIISGGLY